MLKRLSPFHTGDGPQPAQYTRPGSVSPSSAPPINGYFNYQPHPPALSTRTSFLSNNDATSPAPPTNPLPPSQQERMLDRNGLQKSLLALENLLQCLDEYRELNVRLVKAQKRLAKASRELAVGLPCTPNEKPDAIGKALMASSGLFESLSEVDSRFAKAITKEYDTINSLGGKSFKRIAAEEREHEEQLDALNGKILKANVAYEKHVRTLASAAGGQGARRGRLSLDAHEATAAHEKHIQSVAGPTRERSIAKANHAALMAIRRDNVARETALTMTALAESEWRRACEATKRCGVEIGEVVALSNFCHQGMPSLPNDETLVVERTERRGLHVTSDTSSSQPSVLDSPRSTQPTVQARQLPREQPFETPTKNERPAGARPLPMPSGPQYGSPKIEQPERKVSKPTNEATPKAAGRRSATPPEILSPSPRPSRILTTIASLDAAVATPLATPSLSHGVTASTSSDGIVVSPTASEISPATAPLRLRGDSDRKDGRSELGAGRPLPKGFVWEEAEEAATKRAGGVARNASIESTESSRSFVARMKERYAEERAANEQSRQSSHASSPSRDRPGLPSGSSRVADMASRYGERNRLSSAPAVISANRSAPPSLNDELHDDMCRCHACDATRYRRANRRASVDV